jgi:hypothetical protein
MSATKLGSRLSVIFSVGLLAAGAGNACSATSGRLQGAGGSASGTAGNGAGNASGTGGINLTGGSTSAGSGTSNGGATSGVGGACAAQPYQAQLLPLDMYIMQDQSNSMSDTVSEGGTKWQAVTKALTTFVQQPGFTDISIGIQYFGLTPSGCPNTCTTDADCGACPPCDFGVCIGHGSSSDSCIASDYATPEVEIAPLPGVA